MSGKISPETIMVIVFFCILFLFAWIESDVEVLKYGG